MYTHGFGQLVNAHCFKWFLMVLESLFIIKLVSVLACLHNLLGRIVYEISWRRYVVHVHLTTLARGLSSLHLCGGCLATIWTLLLTSMWFLLMGELDGSLEGIP